MNDNLSRVEKDYGAVCCQRVCWSAIFSGVVVGLGLGFLLHLYGVAISLSALSSGTNGAPVIAIGGLLGLLVGVIASMGIAGFVSGYLGRFHYYPLHGGVMYGFITWSLILFITALSAGPIGHYMDLYGKTVARSSVVHTPGIMVVSDTVDNGTETKKVVVVKENKANVTPTQLAWGGWVVFALFLVGALSSCVGACCGIRCKRESRS